ncbi:uncharacterized protein LOC142336984 isoform X2 [Convolutriloba macropyga]|uniref:uncharacterized protein LOC142336984 isoform X2 n=1 Tax=Convolutriloba macropyga TaxID=536237 RepID=UPI003F51BB15
MPPKKAGRKASKGGAGGKRRGSKKGRKSKGGKRRTSLQPIEYKDAEAQVDLMAERRRAILEQHKRENEMRKSRQEQLLEHKSKELQRLLEKKAEIGRRCEEMEGKEEEVRSLSHVQRAQTLERRRKSEQLEAIEAQLREENRLLSENIFKQTDELMRPGGAGGGGEGEDEGKGCEWCDPYIKETVSMYFDILYQEWSNSSLSMVILKSWEEKRRVLERERDVIEKMCMLRSTDLQAELERELKFLQSAVNIQDEDNTNIAVHTAKAINSMDQMQTEVTHMREVIQTLFTAEQYAAKLSQQEEDIGNLRNLIEETAARAEECQAELEESKEAERLEEQLAEIRSQNRLTRDTIKEMESKYKEMVDKWKHNENVYRTVSHNFKFDFLPRLAAERDELKAKIDKYKDEEEDIGKQIEDISQDILRIEQNNKELRLKVEELTFEQRCLKNQISKQDDTLSSKQRELSKCQGEIKSASESQASVLKQIKMLQTIKERTEKKLKWGVNDLKVDRIRNFQKDLMACVLEKNFDTFVEKFTNLINAYA